MNAIKLVSVTKVSQCEGQSNFLQSQFWTDFKTRHGWECISFSCVAQDVFCKKISFFVRVLTRHIAKIFTLAYVPMGPFVPNCDKDSLLYIIKDISNMIKQYLPNNTICIRFDPPIEFASIDEKKISLVKYKHILCKATVDIQPPDTVLLDLSLDLDTLLSNMKPKWRYNIRLSQKKGVKVKCYNFNECSEEEFNNAIDVFYELYKITAIRDGIAIHKKEYYIDLLQHTTILSRVSLLIAYHGKDALAGIITLEMGNAAVYLYGASGAIKRNFMAAYLLQWTSIMRAKDYGCRIYDFYGIPPTDDKKHPMHGLYLFKTGFAGRIVHRIGSFDVPMSLFYPLFRYSEKIRAFWSKVIKKRIRGR